MSALRIHLARFDDPQVDWLVDTFRDLATRSAHGHHTLVEDPADADVVLVTQMHLLQRPNREGLLESPAVRRFLPRVRVYDERDKAVGEWPGVYASADRRWFDPRHHRSWGYAGLPVGSGGTRVDAEPDLLFSFVGTRSHPCRAALLRIAHPDAYVEEVTQFMFWDEDGPRFQERRERFNRVLERSRFVLCPRGRGTSSFRLFETLAAGRVPVIMSDDWVMPIGPAWERFALRVAEDDVDGMVRAVEAADARWAEMAASARAAYDTYFAPERGFGHIADALAQTAPIPTVRRVVRTARWKGANRLEDYRERVLAGRSESV
jgi:hypothetical protein